MRKQAKIIKYAAISAILLGLTIYIFIAIYIAKNVYFDNKTQSDAVIVLGARSFVNNEVNQCVVARVTHAVDLYNDGYAKKIILSGGTDKRPTFKDTNEALEMKKIALSYDENLREENILIEDDSTSTYENLAFSQKIMNENDLHSAIIVTEPFHSPRAKLIAERMGLNFYISPTLTSPCWNKWTYFSTYFFREPIALIAYKILGQI